VETGPQVAALEEEVQRLRQAADERKQKGEKQVFFIYYFFLFLFTLWGFTGKFVCERKRNSRNALAK
jgi:hypothetical protein